MVTMGYDYDLIRELKHNWTIGLVADLTIASLHQSNFYGLYEIDQNETIYEFFDSNFDLNYLNKNPTEDWKSRPFENVPTASGADLDVNLTQQDIQEIYAGFGPLIQSLMDKMTDIAIFDDLNQEMWATLYYNKISSINPNITLDMVKTSYGFWPRDIYMCKLWSIDMGEGSTIFHISQFYKIDSSTSFYECFVNELGRLTSHNLEIGNHAIEIEERNDLRGRTLKVARLKTYTTEDSSIYTIFMNFLASSLNAR